MRMQLMLIIYCIIFHITNCKPLVPTPVYGQLISNKDAKATQWRKESLFTGWC